jgi:cystathionine gamma-synthase
MSQALTSVIRAGVGSDSSYRDVIAPVHLTSTFAMSGLGEVPEYDYSRANNPTRSLFGKALAELEGGFDAVVTASGMGAISAVLAAVGPKVVLAADDAYGGTWRLLDALARRGAFEFRTARLSDLAAARSAITPDVDLVFVESPSNPLLRLTDIAAVSALAHSVGAVVAADNTFATPINCQPLALGADVVVHSATKYLAGHSDVVLGAAVAGSEDMHEELKWWANCIGVTAGAFDAYLGMRGLRTLQLRMERAQANAAAIAEFLEGRPSVGRVYYPGLPSHPSFELAERQQRGFGAMVSFELDGFAAAKAFTEKVSLFTLAESLGGVESLVAHPATMTHAAMSAEVRAEAGITDGLLRLSVGVEPVEDLLADLERAL